MAQTQANIDAEINTLLQSGIDITAATLRQVLHDMNSTVFQSGVTGFDTPSAQVGLTAQAGSATNAIRADGAPALNQGITPLWTGQHVFASGNQSSSQNTGAIVVNGPGGIGVGGNIFAGGVISTGTLGTAGVLMMSGSISGQSSITINGLGTQFQAGGSFQALGGLSCNGAVNGTTNPAPVEVAQRLTGTVSGTVSTTDILVTVVSGATITSVVVYTTTAFGASGSVNLTAGTGIGDNAYIAATNIKSLGLTTTTFSSSAPAPGNLASMPNTSPNFWIRLTQTGSTSVVGAALILVKYVVIP